MILDVRGMRKSYGARRVVDVDRFRVRREEFVVLQGPNGSGKTTLLKLLARLLFPDSCDGFALDGVPVSGRGPDPRVVFLHQSPYLFDMSVRANVEYGLRRRGDSRARERAEEALRDVGMAGAADRGIGGLSGGEAQRVALARVWALRPMLYLLDEPTAHLDREGTADVWRILSGIRGEDGASVVVSSHDSAAPRLGDVRVVRIDGGRLADAADPGPGLSPG